jgi:HD-GYP domain-containing protein (c-di-GMP phosphodiesterase class II)
MNLIDLHAARTLASHRTYRPAFTVTEALRMIVTETGSTFDPDVVKALTTVVPEWDRLCA